MSAVTPIIDVHLTPDDLAEALLTDARAGLTTFPKSIPPKYFYDDRGSELFDEITRLPEYYPTNCERQILHERSGQIAVISGADTIVELGSGTSEKTRVLLDAFDRSGALRRFIAFDVSEGVLRFAAEAITAEHPDVEVRGVVGDFEHHLGLIPVVGRRMIAFLGGTIGNLEPAQRKRFLADLASNMREDDTLLLGTDLVKDPARLVAAYDDSSGVTAEFNRNVLSVLNHRLGAHFNLANFEHVAEWDETNEWMQMSLRSVCDQTVHIDALDLDVSFETGELMRTEISAKFRPDGVREELAAAGLRMCQWWTDSNGDFGLSMSRKS